MRNDGGDFPQMRAEQKIDSYAGLTSARVKESAFFISVSKTEEDAEMEYDYCLHASNEQDLMKALVQQSCLVGMWLAEMEYEGHGLAMRFSQVEKIERCRTASRPEKLRLVLSLKDENRQFRYEPFTMEPLIPVYTLAQFDV